MLSDSAKQTSSGENPDKSVDFGAKIPVQSPDKFHGDWNQTGQGPDTLVGSLILSCSMTSYTISDSGFLAWLGLKAGYQAWHFGASSLTIMKTKLVCQAFNVFGLH